VLDFHIYYLFVVHNKYFLGNISRISRNVKSAAELRLL
jgi:hypothetical protein